MTAQTDTRTVLGGNVEEFNSEELFSEESKHEDLITCGVDSSPLFPGGVFPSGLFASRKLGGSDEEERHDNNEDDECLPSTCDLISEDVVSRTTVYSADGSSTATSTDISNDSESTTRESECCSSSSSSFSPLPQPFSNTMIFFDWDDTLCPSSWLNIQELTLDESSVVPEETAELLGEMAECSRSTLRLASSLGRVVIVTNAEQGWVEMSCAKFLPSLLEELKSYERLSARSKYESEDSNQFAWKQHAFREAIKQQSRRVQRDIQSSMEDPTTCTGIPKLNVISFGDSQHERIALQAVCKGEIEPLVMCLAKSIKLIERPQLEELIKEHQLIIEVLPTLAEKDHDLDLCIRSSAQNV